MEDVVLHFIGKLLLWVVLVYGWYWLFVLPLRQGRAERRMSDDWLAAHPDEAEYHGPRMQWPVRKLENDGL